MRASITPIKRSRSRGTPDGKNGCVSFAGHELELMDVWDELAKRNGVTKAKIVKDYLRSQKPILRDLKELDGKFMDWQLWTN